MIELGYQERELRRLWLILLPSGRWRSVIVPDVDTAKIALEGLVSGPRIEDWYANRSERLQRLVRVRLAVIRRIAK